MSHAPSLSFGPEWMRPKPLQTNSSSSNHLSAQLPANGNAGAGTGGFIDGKPKAPKYPSWSSISSKSHVPSPAVRSATRTTAPYGGHKPDSDVADNAPKLAYQDASLVNAPPIPSNENGKRYSREELIDVWVQMKSSGRLQSTPPMNFPPESILVTETRKAKPGPGTGGGTAKEGSMEYDIFFAGTRLAPELYMGSGLSETESQKSPPPDPIALQFKELQEADPQSNSPFLHNPLLPATSGSSSNSLRPVSTHFPIPSLDDIPSSTASPSLQQQSALADSILPTFPDLPITLPDFASPFIQPAGSSWSPFGGTPNTQHAQLQSQSRSPNDHDPFMPSIFGAPMDPFSPMQSHQSFPPQPAQHQLSLDQFAPPPPPGLTLPPILVPAPLIQWVYLDNSGMVQGPFAGPMMQEWYVNQWLASDLKIKRVEERDYYSLSEFCALVGNDLDPFLIPLPRVDFDINQFQQPQQSSEQQASDNVGLKDKGLSSEDTKEEEKNSEGPGEESVEAKKEPTVTPEQVTEPPAAKDNHDYELVSEPEGNVLAAVTSNEPRETAPKSPPKPASAGQSASTKHKLQPLPPATTLVTKLGAGANATPSPNAHSSVPVAPWAKASAEKKKTLSLKEIEEREARAKKMQEQQLQEQRKALENLNLTTGNFVASDLSGSAPPGLPRSATWAKAAHVPTVKKTLVQIQKEEEEARQRKAAAQKASSSPGIVTPQGRKYADIMSSKPTTFASRSALPGTADGSWTTIGAGGKKMGGPVSATPTTSASVLRRTVTAPAPAASVVRKPGNGIVKPSSSTDEFFKWCRLMLKGVNPGVNAEEVLSMLLSLPLGLPDTVEIIADTVYSYSTTMDGRRFAEEFVKRRKAVDGGISNESLVALVSTGGDKPSSPAKTPDEKTGEGWNEVLVKGNAKALKAAANGGSGNDGWNSVFKVVGGKKKGKR